MFTFLIPLKYLFPFIFCLSGGKNLSARPRKSNTGAFCWYTLYGSNFSLVFYRSDYSFSFVSRNMSHQNRTA
jgi:hypothetical protein